jgi:hypothetical protein
MNDVLRFEELVVYYPHTCIVHRSPSFMGLKVRVGLFHQLPYRTDVYFEVPVERPTDPGPAVLSSFVPDVRVWAFWTDGILIQTFHQYPDRSACTYMQGEWIWGRDPIHDLVDWCVCWCAKVLHLQFFDRWPGPHHCSAHARFSRTKPDEYCGCGARKRYRSCHMLRDAARTVTNRLAEHQNAADAYIREMERRRLDRTPDWLPFRRWTH